MAPEYTVSIGTHKTQMQTLSESQEANIAHLQDGLAGQPLLAVEALDEGAAWLQRRHESCFGASSADAA